LDELYDSSVVLDGTGKNRYVIFSDLHMGDGSAKDDGINKKEIARVHWFDRNNSQNILIKKGVNQNS